MLRCLIASALIFLAARLLVTAVQLLTAAHRLTAGGKPAPQNVAVIATDDQPMPERFGVRMSIEDILHRTLH